MRISNVEWGSDTGMYLVDVVLETAEERILDERAIWRELGPLFAARQIAPEDVVDIFLYTETDEGDLRPWPK
jgi:hypothetical protein